MRWLLLIGVVGGCDYVFPLRAHHDAPPGDVMNDAPIDAAFDPSSCPAGYISLGGLPNSKYRFVLSDDMFSSHDSRCRLDGSSTHLVLIETRAEGFAIDMHLDVLNLQDYFWVGATQAPTAAAVDEGWTWLSGRPVDLDMWGANEPGDGNDGLENQQEDRAMTSRFGTGMDLIDAPGGATHFAICECDGVLVR